MSTNRQLARAGIVTATVAAAGLLSTSVASAHVTANIYGDQPEHGGYGGITMRVPNEDADNGTVRVAVSIPEEYALGSVRTQPVPGWTADITTTSLDEPVTNSSGAELDEVVTEIEWTADEGQQIAAGETEYQEFPFTAGPIPDDVEELVLPATQEYEGGKEVAWDEPPTDDGAEPERPAPVVPVTEPSGGHGDGGGADGPDGSPDGDADAADDASVDNTARWLGGAGLAAGALGVGFGFGATLNARKRSREQE